MAKLIDALPSGSYLVLAHPASDIRATEMAEMTKRVNQRMSGPGATMRDLAAVTRFFDGLELVDPGLVQPSNGAQTPLAVKLSLTAVTIATLGAGATVEARHHNLTFRPSRAIARPLAARGPRGLPHRSLSEVVASRDATTSGGQRGRDSNIRRATRRFLPGKEQHQSGSDAPGRRPSRNMARSGRGPESNSPSRQTRTQPDLQYPRSEYAYSPGRVDWARALAVSRADLSLR